MSHILKWIAVACLSSTLGASAFAQEVSFHCETKLGNSTPRSYLKITYENQTIKNLMIDGYTIIKGSKKLTDGAIGLSVFNVVVGNLIANADGSQELNVSLQDYSDLQSWKIVMSESSNEVAVLSTFQSSDGDDKLHVDAVSPICK